MDDGIGLVQRFFETVNAGDRAGLQQLAAPRICTLFEKFMDALIGVQIVVEDAFASGDRVCTRGTFEGVHERDWWLLPQAQGERVAAAYIDIWRTEQGKLVENWVEYHVISSAP